MAEKKKDKDDIELLGGAQPVSDEVREADKQQREAALQQHEILVENIEARRCPYHGEDLKVQREKRKVKKLDDLGRETNDWKEITVHFAVCNCVIPGGVNPYRGKRVWERT